MSRLHLKLKSRSHTAVGVMIHEIAHVLLAHSGVDWKKREVFPYYDPDEGGPTREAWEILNEIEADMVTEECLRMLGFTEEAQLRKRRIEAHYLIDRTKMFEEVIPQVRGIGPLVRVVGRRVLPPYDEVRQNQSITPVISTIVASVHRRQLVLK